MSRQFSATLLLDRPWSLNVDAIAAAMRTLYPSIGEVEALPDQFDEEERGAIAVEGATVILKTIDAPLGESDLNAPLKTLRAGGVEDAAASHRACLVVSASGDLPGLEGGEAYAAVVHFVAAAALSVTPARAVFWKTGWALTRAETFATAANMLLKGKMPVGTWISFATIVPSGMQPESGLGMVTYGLKPFVGRELELAPRPGDARMAFEIVSSVCRTLLNRGKQLSDGMVLKTEDQQVRLTVRERRYWLRRDLSAFVLIADDSVIDTKNLQQRNESYLLS